MTEFIDPHPTAPAGSHNPLQRQTRYHDSIVERANRWQEAVAVARRSLAEIDAAQSANAVAGQIAGLKTDLQLYQNERVTQAQLARTSGEAGDRFRLETTGQRIAGMEKAIALLADDPLAARREIAKPMKRLKGQIGSLVKLADAAVSGRADASEQLLAMADFGAEQARPFFKDSDDSDLPRYTRMDRIYNKGEEQVFQQPEFRDQIAQLSLIPLEARQAKWNYMVALGNAIYDFGLDATDREIVARLFTRMSEHRRGENNASMADTHKFRHGPAIHSLHAAGLVDKLFHQAIIGLDSLQTGLDSGPGAQQDHARAVLVRMGLTRDRDLLVQVREARDYLLAQRTEAIASTLVHDAGENRGELSFASDKQSKAVDADALEHGKKELERQRYIDALQEALGALNLPVDERKARLECWTRRFDRVEEHNKPLSKTRSAQEAFLGRYVKAGGDRSQSQHDYVRFARFNKKVSLKRLTAEQKQFSGLYVPQILFHLSRQAMAAIVEENPTPTELLNADFAAHQGDLSLLKLKEMGNPVEKLAQNLLTDSLLQNFHQLETEQKQHYLSRREQDAGTAGWLARMQRPLPEEKATVTGTRRLSQSHQEALTAERERINQEAAEPMIARRSESRRPRFVQNTASVCRR